MKTIILSQGKVALVDDDMYDFLMQWKWYAHKEGKEYYAVRAAGKHSPYKVHAVRMHRVVHAYQKFGPCFSAKQYHSMDLIDHRFHKTLDNRRSVLREVSNRGNQWNREARGMSQYPCVHVKRYTTKAGVEKVSYTARAKVCYGNRLVSSTHVGSFNDEHAAGQAAQEARKYVEGNNITDPELIKQWARDKGYRKK